MHETGRDVSENQRDVVISKGFWCAETEITQRQWMAIMDNNPSYTKGGILPVTGMTWHEAEAFTQAFAKHIPATFFSPPSHGSRMGIRMPRREFLRHSVALGKLLRWRGTPIIPRPHQAHQAITAQCLGSLRFPRQCRRMVL